MGLLTVPLTLVRAPMRVTLRAWEFGLSTAAEGARIGLELLEPNRDTPREFVDNGVPDAPPAVPDELIPDHVDDEVVLVAEASATGIEDGAGPELHVDPPWDGYDQMTAAGIRDRLSAGTATEAAAVELYESTAKARRSVLDAAERALRNPRR
jgi:hypothetical protein